MQLNNLLERKLNFIVAVILLIFCFTINFNSFGLNKTVGMAYDIGGIAKLTCLVSLFLSFILYSILSLLKYKTKKVLSIIYLSDILPAIILIFMKAYEISIIFSLMSIVVSVINFLNSLRAKDKTSP